MKKLRPITVVVTAVVDQSAYNGCLKGVNIYFVTHVLESQVSVWCEHRRMLNILYSYNTHVFKHTLIFYIYMDNDYHKHTNLDTGSC